MVKIWFDVFEKGATKRLNILPDPATPVAFV
jgi:hypothetical protein